MEQERTCGAGEEHTLALLYHELKHSLLLSGQTELLVDLEVVADEGGRGAAGPGRGGRGHVQRIRWTRTRMKTGQVVKGPLFLWARLLASGGLHEVPWEGSLLLDRLGAAAAAGGRCNARC